MRLKKGSDNASTYTTHKTRESRYEIEIYLKLSYLSNQLLESLVLRIEHRIPGQRGTQRS